MPKGAVEDSDNESDDDDDDDIDEEDCIMDFSINYLMCHPNLEKLDFSGLIEKY